MAKARKFHISVIAVGLVFLFGGIAASPRLAFAQNQGTNSGDKKNSGDNANPDDTVKQPELPAQSTKSSAPTVFHSPFNGEKKAYNPPEGEHKDFNDLLDLYDTMKDAESALAFARKCGSADDVKKAQSALDKATEAFSKAMFEYINGWSNLTYSGFTWYPGTGFVNKSQQNIESNGSYKADRQKVMDSLAQADKKQHAVGDCPPKTENTTGGASGSKPKPDAGAGTSAGTGKGKPKRRKKHAKRAITEDDPRYLENYSAPRSHASAPHSHSDSGESEPPPPPQEDSNQPQRSPDLPQLPNSMPN